MSDFKAKRVTRTYTQKLAAPPDQVFPLLCPVREKEWLDGWEYRMVYSESGLAEKGCVFAVRHPGEPETIWIITSHDKQNHDIKFSLFTPDIRVGRIEIHLDGRPDGATAAQVSYTFTGLSEQGNRFVDEYTEEHFMQRMLWWEKAMNHFIATGELLKADSLHKWK